ncbi:TPA: hypothetical protein DIC39_02305 [Patescibacteria group bacterium]|nr:hypothetical protein [Patescibacteria group bacterium]HCU47867.1 hypothetical protein [Patescibacteria group bacterium]
MNPMETPLSPSAATETDLGLTEGQIGKVCEMIAAALRKGRKSFRSNAVQNIIEQHGPKLQEEMTSATVTVFENIIAWSSNIIARAVKVVRSRTPKEMIKALGRAEYTDNSVVKAIPKGEGDEVIVEFFKLGQYVSMNDLAREYAKRGLTPDPYAQAAANEADPTFADKHPNGAQWKDEDGNWCYIAFDRDDDGRCVDVGRSYDDWYDCWWFGGVRKSR